MRIMKRLSILLIITMLLSMLAGCGALPKITFGTQDDTTNGNNTEDTTPVETNDNTEPSETFGEGQELTAFVTPYSEMKTAAMTVLSDYYSEKDFMAALALAGMMMSDLNIISVSFFDIAELMGGTFGFGEIDTAFKKIEGNIITFGYDFTYAEGNSSSYPVGSKSIWAGEYNMAKGSMKFEMIDDKGADGYTRTVVELNKISDNSYISQSISYSENNSGDPTCSGTFSLIKGEDIWCANGSKAAGKDFSINSIYGRNVTSIDDMTGGFDITMTASYVGGEASYENTES